MTMLKTDDMFVRATVERYLHGLSVYTDFVSLLKVFVAERRP